MNLRISKEQDTINRFFSAYINSVEVLPESSYYLVPISNMRTFDLGDYTQHSDRKLTLRIRWGAYKEYGWKLHLLPSESDGFRVSYLAANFEVDYMTGHYPDNVAFDYIEDYYLDRGFQRVNFVIDEEVPFDSSTTYSEFLNYYTPYYNHIVAEPMWKYIVFGNECDIDGLGWNSGRFIFIADGSIISWVDDRIGVTYTQVRKVVVMHEMGHSLGIGDVDSNGDEDYCDTWNCVMAKTRALYDVRDNPWYCTHHWSQRYFPL